MSKKEIRISFTNGISFENGVRDILNVVSSEYEFVESNKPDFIIFGPYGDDIPEGRFVRIGYYCENMKPDMSICDWAFGMLYEDEVADDRYLRIQWHGFDALSLVKEDLDIDRIISQKTRFCNFIYSNPVSHRERFFTALSKYKRVDAPGKSMNNMPSIDLGKAEGDMWARKRTFLSQYKFTIAFENYAYAGYHTEKILDPMTVDSLPIYLGNPMIGQHFNPRSFINAQEYLHVATPFLANALAKSCQPTFKELRTRNSFQNRVKRRIKAQGRTFRMNIRNSDFERLVDRIIEIDRNDDLYAKYLSEPWFHNNMPPSNEPVVNRWRQIFG